MFLKFDALGPGAYTQRKLGRCLARAFDGGEYSQSRLLWVDAVEKVAGELGDPFYLSF
jgi:hypothetical protein